MKRDRSLGEIEEGRESCSRECIGPPPQLSYGVGKADWFRYFENASTLVIYSTTAKQLLVHYDRVIYREDGDLSVLTETAQLMLFDYACLLLFKFHGKYSYISLN